MIADQANIHCTILFEANFKQCFLTMCTFKVISSRKHACELDTGVSRSRLGLIEMLMRGR